MATTRARGGHRASRRRGPYQRRVPRQGTQDPHAIVPKRSFSVSLNRADLLIVNGQGLETAWLPTAPRRVHECTDSRRQTRLSGCLDRCGADPLRSRGREGSPRSEDSWRCSPSSSRNRRISRPATTTTTGSTRRTAIRSRRPSWTSSVLLDPANATVFQANYDRFAAKLREKLGRMGCADEALRGDGDRELPIGAGPIWPNGTV